MEVRSVELVFEERREQVTYHGCCFGFVDSDVAPGLWPFVLDDIRPQARKEAEKRIADRIIAATAREELREFLSNLLRADFPDLLVVID